MFYGLKHTCTQCVYGNRVCNEVNGFKRHTQSIYVFAPTLLHDLQERERGIDTEDQQSTNGKGVVVRITETGDFLRACILRVSLRLTARFVIRNARSILDAFCVSWQDSSEENKGRDFLWKAVVLPENACTCSAVPCTNEN